MTKQQYVEGYKHFGSVILWIVYSVFVFHTGVVYVVGMGKWSAAPVKLVVS